MNQSPSHHIFDAGFLTAGVAALFTRLPDIYNILSVILVLMGIGWYIRQFYLSFQNKKNT